MASPPHNFDRRGAQRIVRAVRWVESQRPDERRAVGPHRGTPDFISIYNNSGVVIPPYSLVRREGSDDNRTEPVTVSVVKPDTTFSRDYLVTGALEIPVGEYGLAQRGDYVYIACDSIYSAGAGVGPKPGDFEAVQYYPVVADLVSYATEPSERTGLNVFLAHWRPMEKLLVATTSSISAGGSATVQVRQASSSTGVDVSGWTVPVVNLFDAITASSTDPQPMLAHWDSGRWYVPPMGGTATAAYGHVANSSGFGSAATLTTAHQHIPWETLVFPSANVTHATSGIIVSLAGLYRYDGSFNIYLATNTTNYASARGYVNGTVNSTIMSSTSGNVSQRFDFVVRDTVSQNSQFSFPIHGLRRLSAGDTVGMMFYFTNTTTDIQWTIGDRVQFCIQRIGD